MSDQRAIRVLNKLRAAESSSLLGHLADTGYFVTMMTADDAEALKRIEREEREHVQWLEEAIFELRGGLWPGRVDTRQAGYHYWDLAHLMPKIVEEKAKLVDEYAAAAGAVENETASSVIARIYQRQQRHLDTLERLQAGHQTSS